MAVTGQRPFGQLPLLLLALAAALAACSSVCHDTQSRLYKQRATGLLPNVTPAAILSPIDSRALCVKACWDLLNFQCCAVGYNAERKECHAHSDPSAGDVTSAAPGFTILSQGLLGDPCSVKEDCSVENAECQNNQCQCQTGPYYSARHGDCQKRDSCQGYFDDGWTTSGIYTLHLSDGHRPMDVFCDMTTDGGAWTVFQRRQDGTENFHRNWTAYEDGFGNLTSEFWLGNRNIHRLTSAGRTRLRVDLEDWDASTAYAIYSHFFVGDASSSYKLSVSGYSGSAGDSLGFHTNLMFSTPDRDNDNWSGHCARDVGKGGWWQGHCLHCNLNGLYGDRGSVGKQYIQWIYFRGDDTLKGSVMMIK